jgi:hypothetical protein
MEDVEELIKSIGCSYLIRDGRPRFSPLGFLVTSRNATIWQSLTEHIGAFRVFNITNVVDWFHAENRSVGDDGHKEPG